MALALGVEAGVGIAWALVFGRRRREGGIEQPHPIILKAYIQNFSLLLKMKYNESVEKDTTIWEIRVEYGKRYC